MALGTRVLGTRPKHAHTLIELLSHVRWPPVPHTCPHLQVDLDEILREVDQDHDGRINYDEFCTCFRKHEDVSGLCTTTVFLHSACLPNPACLPKP